MHDPINHARDIALQTLNPSPKELEHGLKLHAESVVCESYGFGPYAAPDGQALNKMVEANYPPQLIRDAIEKMKMTGFVHNQREQDQYFRAWQASGVTCVFQNAGFESQSIPETLKRFAHYIHVTDSLSPEIRKAITPSDVIEAHKNDQQCIFLTCNVIPLPQNWQYEEEELSYIEYFFELGCRMMHFTYNRRNMFGDGCMETANGGVSELGKKAIKAMNRAGMIIDVAHSGQQTSIEAAQLSDSPIVASHSGAYAINPHPRNKNDQTIKAIVDKQGVVGVCAIPAFLGQTGDINALLNHVEYIAKKFGTDCVSIGTDRIHESQYTAEEMNKVSHTTSGPNTFEFLWQKNEPLFAEKWNNPNQWQSLTWTNWPFFTVGLVQRGYCDDDIKKIIGGNILRAAGDILKKRITHP